MAAARLVHTSLDASLDTYLSLVWGRGLPGLAWSGACGLLLEVELWAGAMVVARLAHGEP